jgi:cell division protein FtsX
MFLLQFFQVCFLGALFPLFAKHFGFVSQISKFYTKKMKKNEYNTQNWHVMMWRDVVTTMIIMDVVDYLYSC